MLLRLRIGDEGAFAVIYERYWGVLYAHALKMLADADAAMDVVQDIFADLWAQAAALQVHTTLQGYLYTAVRNKALNAIKRSAHRERYIASIMDFAAEGNHTTDEQVNYNELVRRLEQGVADLPPQMRRIFELSRFEGQSHAEIADQLAISDKTVKKTIGRVLKILRGKLTALFF